MEQPIGMRGSRHLALLISLLVLFIFSPFVVAFRFGIIVLNIVGTAVLLSGTYAVSERKQLFRVTLVLAVISIIFSALILIFPRPWIILAEHVSLLFLLGLFSISILGNVLRAGQVTVDKILGAICVYLLIGYAWAFGYTMIEELEPGSLSGAANPKNFVTLVMQMRYFSFATLTTVGYGDIVPQSQPARTFAMLEAVAGQMYLAVLVARLVGLHIVHASRSRSSLEK